MQPFNLKRAVDFDTDAPQVWRTDLDRGGKRYSARRRFGADGPESGAATRAQRGSCHRTPSRVFHQTGSAQVSKRTNVYGPLPIHARLTAAYRFNGCDSMKSRPDSAHPACYACNLPGFFISFCVFQGMSRRQPDGVSCIALCLKPNCTTCA